jgi:biotin carboxyl carrier protein
MRFNSTSRSFFALILFVGLGLAGCFVYDRWPFLAEPSRSAAPTDPAEATARSLQKIIVNEKAQQNLGLVSKPLKAETFWRTILVPGMVVDRPGLSDRGVVAPATSVVTRIARVPGDTVRPGEALFTLRLLSESLHSTQTELFKATEDLQIAQAQRQRYRDAAAVVPEARIIEVDNQITRLQVAIKADRQELQNRGFSKGMIDQAASGKFVNEITIAAPSLSPSVELATGASGPTFEMQELKVGLGHQVQAGQTLCLLANHQNLAIEGRAFRDETAFLERSVQERWPVGVDFQEESTAGWGEVTQAFHIEHLANTIDPLNRTFAFRMPLENQWRIVDHGGRMQTLWRFRPGQKVRIHVRVEKFVNVFVVPAEAVTRDGLEVFTFTQNVNTFERRPVRILLQDRKHAVLANDGSIVPGSYVVQSAAAQLNRMIEGGGSSGVPKGYHVHADGSLHKNEDEGK